MKLLREVTNEEQDDLMFFVDETAVPVLLEAQEKAVEPPKKLDHLHHLEDLPIVGGFHGFSKAIEALSKTHDHLSGKRRSGYSIQTKFDGYPSIVWGRKDGKFFIGTKSFFNKTPKINFNDKDIDANHGNSPRLAEKLKFLFPILKASSPKEGIFQGDLMYTGDEVSSDGKHVSFTPNTITYNVDKNSHQGQKIMKSKAGIAAHTHYEEGPGDNLRAVFDIDTSKFKPTDDVHFLPTKLRGPFNYKSADMSKFLDSLRKASASQRRLIQSKAFDAIKDHEPLLMTYINDSIRQKRSNSVEGYIAHLYSQLKKKSESAGELKGSIKTQLDAEVQNVMKNRKAFEELFNAHKHLQSAKNTLVDVLSRHSPYKETILGEPSKPEGFVITTGGHPIKLVDRNHFSSANFDFNSKVNPNDNPLVLHWGRFQGITAGHERMVKKGEDIARRTGARHEIVTTRSQDKDKNPMTPQQKLSWLKTIFPGKNVSVAAPDRSTVIAQLQHFHNQGVKDITIVAGDDKVKDYQHILSRYNGPGKLFQFNRARVVSAGARDKGSKGVSGASGTKLRDSAKTGDFKSFKAGLPQSIKPKDATKYFHDMRASMGVVKINQTTSGHALSTLAKRKDKVGREAQGEIDRRKRNGTWRGS